MRANEIDSVLIDVVFGAKVQDGLTKHGPEVDIELRHVGRSGVEFLQDL
jgi:hypothetical protein